MPAINTAIVARDAVLVARENFAQREAGVIVVFAIVGTVGIGLVSLWIHKCVQKRKAKKLAAGGH
ncbi:hypothetical protein F5Y16DRAFT_246389 [Xylariaceae sp. FL0255]|nr:hypothetical protein F5Y16DRAFT_246389 [Xylariaceae sp. FL0255]